MTVCKLVTGNLYLSVGINIRATVVLLVAELVEDILTSVHIVQVYGIDGRNVTTIHEGVGVTAIAGTVAGVECLMGSIDVQTGLEPLLRLHVNHCTTRDTVEARGLQVTVLVQITYREQVVGLIGSTVGAQVVLLTLSVVDSLVIPVEILTIGTLHGCGCQLTVRGKQGIVSSLIDVQIQTVCNQVLRSVGGSCSSIVASSYTIVLHIQPLSLHPLVGTHHVVLGNTTAVSTQLHVEVDVQLTLLTLLGGDQDHTVRSTVTIQSCRGSVLQH